MADQGRTSALSFAEYLIDESADALLAVTLEGRVLSWNRGAQAMFGYTVEEAVGASIDDLTVPEEGHAEARRAFEEARDTGSMLTEAIRRHQNGSVIRAAVSMRRVDVTDGEAFVAVSATDVTALTRLHELQTSDAGLTSELLARMSHELRTPLNAIIGFAELMHTGKVGPVSAEHEEYLGDILTSSKRLLQVINDLLDLATVESGKTSHRAGLDPTLTQRVAAALGGRVTGGHTPGDGRVVSAILPRVVTMAPAGDATPPIELPAGNHTVIAADDDPHTLVR